MFKKGDKVLCIRGSTDDLIQSDELLQWTTYTIVGYYDSRKVNLQESKYAWFSDRFILLTALTEALV